MNLLTNLSLQLLYIDPAATSILLTSITAIVLTVSASAIIIWRKLKKKMQKTFKIDPNSGKEIEEDLVITEDSEETSNEAVATETEVVEQKSNQILTNETDEK